MQWAQLNKRWLDEGDCELISQLNAAVYPTPEPVSRSTFCKWFAVDDPKVSWCYLLPPPESQPSPQRQPSPLPPEPEPEPKPESLAFVAGIAVFIPLNSYGWSQLTMGRKTESSLGPEHLYEGNRDTDLYLHCYHIEKITPNQEGGGFAHRVLLELAQTVAPHRVSGVSALCVTPAGIHLFSHVWGFVERRRCEERVWSDPSDGGALRVTTRAEFEGGDTPLPLQRWEPSSPCRAVARCRMLVLERGNASPVWDGLDGVGLARLG